MDSLELLVFDIWGDYGFFRIPYTTTSSMSYPFPPKTTISGAIAAILGLPKNSYNETIFNKEDFKLSLRIMTPLNKEILGINLFNTRYRINPKKNR